MLSEWIRERIRHAALAEAPREACGLVSSPKAAPERCEGTGLAVPECSCRSCLERLCAGHDGQTFWQLSNAHPEPETHFFIEPREQFEVLSAIEEAGHELVAIFHSHPQGTPTLSVPDREFAAGWPTVAHVVVADGVIRAYTASGEEL